MTANGSAIRIGVDIGGTFTDIALLDPQAGTTYTDKVPSTPSDPTQGVIDGIRQVLARTGRSPSEVTHVSHGSTVATNALLERKGARTGLVTTRGFRHVLEIGRHDVHRDANVNSWIKPPRPVPASLIAEVRERVSAEGETLVELDEAETRAAAEFLRAEGVESVAVVLLHSYVAPGHERRVREILAGEGFEGPVSLSRDVLPVFREYERTMATVISAYLAPKVSRYIERLKVELAEMGVDAHLLIMKSNGGVMSADTAGDEPIHMVTSGPAAGVVGAIQSAAASGVQDIISLDIGGTSTDIALVRGGAPTIVGDGEVGEFQIPTPMVDLRTIGAGGGSLAHITSGGSLAVGPESAAAVPGPACYGRGGTKPTVTDAHLVLGRISRGLLGGAMQLDVEAARGAIQREVAGPLGLSLEEAALGILEIANNNMLGAVRVISIEQGHRPADFVLVGFGGAGGLHAADVARMCGTERVLIPSAPGILCALGLLGADVRRDYAQTCLERPPNYDLARIERTWSDVAETARAWIAGQGVSDDATLVRRAADLRYAHQGYEVEVPVEADESTATKVVVAQLVEDFHRHHERLYHFSLPDAQVELVNLRVTVEGRLSAAANDFRDVRRPASTELDETESRRQVYFAGKGWVDCSVRLRDALRPAQALAGPTVIEQHDSTVVVPPGWTSSVDEASNLLLELADGTA